MQLLKDFFRSIRARSQADRAQNAPIPAAPPSTEAPAAPPSSDQQQYRQARAFHQQGQLNEAETLYRALLKKYPKDFDLLHFLGVIHGQRNDFATAVAFIEQAVAINPGSASAYSSLGNCLKGLGKQEEALASYDKALTLQPTDADALSNRGATLRDLKRVKEALESYERALAINPRHVVAHYNRGILLTELMRHEEARASYERALALDPDNIEIHRSMGATLEILGQYQDALSHYDRMLTLNPSDPVTYYNRGTVQTRLKRYEEALASYDRALALDARDPDTLCNRGAVLHNLKRYEDALASYEQVLALQPDYTEALINRGATLKEMKRHEDALDTFDRVLAIKPDHAVSHFNRGISLGDLKRYEEALASYDRALALQPDAVETLVSRGVTLRNLHRHDDALAAFDRALALDPQHVISHFNRGITLGDLRRYEEALASYQRALVLQPDHADAHNNRGTLLEALRRHEEALASYGKALALNPDHLSALFNRGILLGLLKRTEGAILDFSRLVTLDPHYHFAQGHLLFAKTSCCDWRDLGNLSSLIAEGVHNGKTATDPFCCVGISDSPEFLKRCAEIYTAQRNPPAGNRLLPIPSRNTGKIRVGYVAGEFRHHATSFLMAGLFEEHDTSRFEVIAFDNGYDDGSAIRKRLNNAFAGIVDISRLGDREAAAAIRSKGIDILVDLNGHVGRRRTGIFSQRPAPIQLNWLGFPGTMGADYMDYIIGDAILIPAGHDAYYSEKVVRMPGTYQVNDAKRAAPARTPTRAEVGLPDYGFVFCCFNNSFKITPDVFDIWMRLLNRVQHSVLWLLEDNPVASRNLRSEATARGVTPERLVFAPRMDLPDHLARQQLADLFLDTLPCNAHTTASDALWAGLPLLTCMGSTFAGRVAGSLLHAIGLPELVTENLTDYETLALKLATTPALLSELRSRLSSNRTTHPLFNTDRFRLHIESAYVTMVERWRRGEAPQNFTVQPIV